MVRRSELASQVATYSMKVRIFDKTFDMGGITGVGTYPEYSNQVMHKLLFQALNDMRDSKQYISYLYPYSIPLIIATKAGSSSPIKSSMR